MIRIADKRPTSCGRLLVALCTMLILPLAATAQPAPVYKTSTFVMGYVSPGQSANVTGYSQCFTSIGNYLWLRSDNSAGIRPLFEVTVNNNLVQINKNDFADGNASYVCLNNSFNDDEIIAGYAASGTNIGAGLSCVLSISNFVKNRVNGGTVPGSVSCSYNSSTGVIGTSSTEAGAIGNCGYICVKPPSPKTTQVQAKRYQRIFLQTENIGSNLSCAPGVNYFYTACSGAGVSTAVYNPATGIANTGFQDGCGQHSFSYLCTASAKFQCADGVDNDGDGVSDAQDPGCWTNPSNPASYDANRPDESVATTQCQDGIDNDGDGATDLIDFSCQNSRIKNDEANPKSQCQDGVDNDNDGATDLIDFSCQNNRQKNDETTPKTQCQDGIDNDNDGAVDLADFSCQSNQQKNDEANPKSACQDGIDNDGDGAIDLADFSCQNNRQRNDEANPKSACQDGIDNDNDGAIDLEDFSCQNNKQHSDEANPKSQCQDGVDNDNDGATDLADFSCSSGQDNDETNPRSQCQDGIDNDNDGATDMADFSCSTRQDNNESDPKSQCQDGIDNDGDGATDLSDFSCSSRQDNDETNPKAQCQDGIDNDADGATDRADFSCSSNQDNDESDPKSSCQDGIDNDNDGLVDSADPGCSNNQDDTEGDEPALLEIGVECVSDNLDGTFTAYFGYDNRGTQPLVLPLNSSAGTINEFSPGAANRGQITSFRPGRNRGAVAVTFDGTPLTWRVRGAGSRLSTATASLSSTPCGRVTPTADCINGSASGLVATFGYTNPNGFDVLIPVGLLNNFSPAPAGRGQPTVFKAGRNAASFTTSFSKSINWNLDGALATVTEATPICQGGCIDKPIGTIKNELNQTALDLAALTKKAAKLLATRAKTSAAQGVISATSASRIGLDAQRAAKKADALAKRAQSLTLGFPEVIKACPFTAPLCQTVDRGPAIEQLRGLFVEQFDQLRRIMARRNFTQTGQTNRADTLVTQARTVKAGGDAQLNELPRIATECE